MSPELHFSTSIETCQRNIVLDQRFVGFLIKSFAGFLLENSGPFIIQFHEFMEDVLTTSFFSPFSSENDGIMSSSNVRWMVCHSRLPHFQKYFQSQTLSRRNHSTFSPAQRTRSTPWNSSIFTGVTAGFETSSP